MSGTVYCCRRNKKMLRDVKQKKVTKEMERYLECPGGLNTE